MPRVNFDVTCLLINNHTQKSDTTRLDGIMDGYIIGKTAEQQNNDERAIGTRNTTI